MINKQIRKIVTTCDGAIKELNRSCDDGEQALLSEAVREGLEEEITL